MIKIPVKVPVPVLVFICCAITLIFLHIKPVNHVIINYQPNGSSLKEIYDFDGKFKVLYHNSEYQIPPDSELAPILLGHIKGEGIVQSIAFHAGFSGIAVFYQADGGKIELINNGHCLWESTGDSIRNIGMPVRLTEWNNSHDLKIAVNTPLAYEKEFKIYFGNSHKTSEFPIRFLHVNGYFKNLSFGEGNKLKFNSGMRPGVTYKSGFFSPDLSSTKYVERLAVGLIPRRG